jgi:hypothetical protein
MMLTNEGAVQEEFTGNHFVEFFFKAGSIFSNPKRASFYRNEENALSLFKKIWCIDKELSFKLLLWLRDCRGGAGNRSGFRDCLNWVAKNNPEWVIANITQIPEVGRWDDLTVCFNTPVEKSAADTWAKAIEDKNVLAAKWCDRKMIPVKRALKIAKEVNFRKLLSSIRQSHIVEHKMTFKKYDEIEYHTVPSLAMARYSNAFKKHDTERFDSFKTKVKTGEVTINTEVLFPHDCARTAYNGDDEIANLQFDNLPNYIDNTKERIIVIADTSGSMFQEVSGSIEAIDISISLALYCSGKIDKNNPFHRKFITFETESEFKDWNGMSFSEALHELPDGHCGSTRIDKALDLILSTAKFFKLSNDMMPTSLIIISDMQFSDGVTSGSNIRYSWNYQHKSGPVTPVKECLQKWVEAGYTPPKIIYWNTAGYTGAPDTVDNTNIAMISGFSPAVLKNIFNGDNLSPMAVLNTTLKKYQVTVPQ